jgi:hypothetical protein
MIHTLASKAFLVPVGLPGLGKTTLARKLASQRPLSLISYDDLLLRQTERYMAERPETPFHDVIDIIRPLADAEYLSRIRDHSSFAYLDRNNTPDAWPSIVQAIRGRPSVLLVPEQPPCHQPYKRPNPISPHLFYHCASRIFHRSVHSCLSGADKPKAIEVLLKFTRLYDHCDLSKPLYFNDVLHVDYGIDSISETTFEAIARAVNATPDGFRPPRKEVIEELIEACDREVMLKL